MLYNNLSTYFRDRYGKRVKKICVDGGFTCPNRDGKCSRGGCVFCGERGSGEHIDPTLSITEQVRLGLRDASPGDVFAVYFQNFTNTYASLEVLRERYDAALIDDRIRLLAVGTRPDCIDGEVARLLASYSERLDVWVELGLQTASDRTAGLINRGYKTAEFIRACELLRDFGIPTVAHIIIGLPGEGREELLQTVELVNSLPVFGLKIHSLYVMEGTRLAEMYRLGEYTPLTLDEYADLAAEAIARARPDIVLHRITGDCPRNMLVAPEWNGGKSRVIDAIRQRLRQMGQGQGSLYESS